MFQYYNALPLGEDIVSDYLMWKLKQHRLTPKYDIMRSLVPLVKRYNVAIEDDGNQLKITCRRCNGFVKFSGRSGELIHIKFLIYGMYTIALHP